MLANSEHFNEIREEAIQLLKYIHEMELSEIAQAVNRITAYKLEITDYLDIIMIWYRDVLLYKADKRYGQGCLQGADFLHQRAGRKKAPTKGSRRS